MPSGVMVISAAFLLSCCLVVLWWGGGVVGVVRARGVAVAARMENEVRIFGSGSC
jgi:hypothetical protein